ncbi:MAG: hypothetical protein GKR87_11480 [Kiritimatiellae bacterium]|nr:hypothetical protein [Kiritimatiellia bacterium]
MNVGIVADTAAFAVESILQWSKQMGKKRYLIHQSDLYLCKQWWQ